MINWQLTLENYNRKDLSGNLPRVSVQCDKCEAIGSIIIRKKSNVINNQMPWECAKCIANRPEKKAKSVAGAKKGWESQEYRDKVVANSTAIWEDTERAEKMSAFRNSDDFKDRMAIINKTKINDKEKLSDNLKNQWKDPEYREKMINSLAVTSKKLWENPEYRNKISSAMTKNWKDESFRNMMVQAAIKNWRNEDFKIKMLSIFGSDEFRNIMVEVNTATWANTEYRSKQLAARKVLWENPEFRAKMEAGLALGRLNCKKVSSLQDTLYSILDDLGITYYREYNDRDDDKECIIGPYSFDCVIPREGKPTLLVECQGDYWHSLDKTIRRDTAKASYIKNNFSSQYELKYIWEHEFSNFNKVIELVKYWLGITTVNLVDFEFKDVMIKDCLAADYKLLLSKYHYLPNAGRGGIAYGAYLDNALIAVCIFSPPIRQNIATGEFSIEETRELSRLCINPKYQKHNLASWFIGKCLKMLPDNFKLIISYCDTTFNHDGATYKACNFTQDRIIAPDYWYAAEDGWVMHKRTLYGQAVNMKMTEAEFAEVNGYHKVWGMEKLRFIYKR